MSIITFEEDDAKALSWVAGGAESSDPGAVLIFDIDGEAESARITTNTGSFIRSLRIKVDDATTCSVALRAKTLSSITSKVEEGMPLALSINEDASEVKVACGPTSLSLVNLYDHVMDLTRRIKRDKVARVSTVAFLDALSNAGSASPKGEVVISFDGDGVVSVGSQGDSVHTLEFYPGDVYEEDHPALQVVGGHFRAVKPLLKLPQIDNLELSVGTGYIVLRSTINDPSSSMSEISMVIPTIVSAVPPLDSPCDENIHPLMEIDRNLLKGALSPLSITGDSSSVTLDAEGDGNVTVSVTSSEGTGKTVILDAKVLSAFTMEVDLPDLMTALKTVSDPVISIGNVDMDESTWLIVTPVDDEDEETDSDDMDYHDGDIVVAVLTH